MWELAIQYGLLCVKIVEVPFCTICLALASQKTPFLARRIKKEKEKGSKKKRKRKEKEKEKKKKREVKLKEKEKEKGRKKKRK